MNQPDHEYSPTKAYSVKTYSSFGVSLLNSFGPSITFFVSNFLLNISGLTKSLTKSVYYASSLRKTPSPTETITLLN